MTGDKRREAILDCAIRLFAAKGFRGTTTRELAAAAGVSEPVLYQHFHNKQAMYTAIIESKAREGHQRIAAIFDRYKATRDDRAVLTDLANGILDRYERDPEYVRLLLYSALERHELAGEFFERQLVHLYDVLAGYLRARMRAGAFAAMDPNAAARLFLGMVNHHGLVRTLFKDTIVKTGRKNLVGAMVRTFLRGMAKA
jgi:AcrR family transcriptional regulator